MTGLGLGMRATSRRRRLVSPFALNPGNKVTNPDAIDNASWTKTAVGVTANALAAPDGSITADLIIPAASAGIHSVTSNTFALGGAPHTIPIYVKPNGYNLIGVREGAVTGAYINFNASTGAVIESAGAGGYTITAGSVTSLSNGWKRCLFTLTGAGVANLGIYALPDGFIGSPNDTGWTPDGVGGLYLWRVQAYP